ncbi:MAG: UvrD-helicase domain-containing protein [Alphaproteobacteria bacterium]|nr:UvrD-helicase domain-containing protein [Alphaproteobacteria bacterium]
MTNKTTIELTKENQDKATNPQTSAWVSASAGSGKTTVLTKRILNLLLSGVMPEKILCLTYTKAAAAEMANRLFDEAKSFLTQTNEQLETRLKNLLTDRYKPEAIKHARTLFAQLLQVKGGIKISNLHSFCESVLSRFPLEAGISPTFQIIDAQEAQHLAQQGWQAIMTDPQIQEQLAVLTDTLSEKTLNQTLKKLLEHKSALNDLKNHQSLESVFVLMQDFFDIKANTTEEQIVRDFYPYDTYDQDIAEWSNQDGSINKNKAKADPEKYQHLAKVLEMKKRLHMLQNTQALLTIAYRFLEVYENLKQEKGVLDYDDLILKTVDLLEEKEQTAWVLYKLDEGIDHVLIDEAQDTSPAQWRIIQKLADDFFAGENAHPQQRTLFVVGDKKQSIFRFQGADPNQFEVMHSFFKTKIQAAQQPWEDIYLNVSFRSTQPILDLVDRTFENTTAKDGVVMPTEDKLTHLAFRDKSAGHVEIWPIEQDSAKKEKTETYTYQVAPNERVAQKIAKRIREMLDNQEILLSENRPIQPRDIMILINKRPPFMPLMLRALKEQHIPLAGVDRLDLSAHIAVHDLLALGSFALLPDDDLTLAGLLKSPIGNISEERLLQLAHNRGQATLFERVRAMEPALYQDLLEILNNADTMPPFEFYCHILTKYRRHFLERLGPETNEVLDEFLNLALNYNENHTPSLQGFLQWMRMDDIQISRELDQTDLNAVRIMTIHGSKGLQSPIVFLPTTCFYTPFKGPILWIHGLPIWLPKKLDRCELCQPFINAMENEVQQEQHRLLYVGLTRAKDRLYIAGFQKKTSSKPTWYQMITQQQPSWTADKIFIQQSEQKEAVSAPSTTTEPKKEPPEESWWHTPAPAEPAAHKTLAPSKLAEEATALPFDEQRQKALEFGTAVHKLLQVMPSVSGAKLEELARRLLSDYPHIAQKLSQSMEKEELKAIFAPDSLTEVPVIGTIDGEQFSGQIDRLVIHDKEVWIVDYKTNRTPPTSPADIPIAYKKQIEIYKCLLKQIFPSKMVRGYLLWTSTMQLMEVL